MKKENSAGRHIIYYNFMDVKARPIRKPRNQNHEKDIDSIFDDIRKMFEGDKRYSNRRDKKPRHIYGNSKNRASSDQRCMVKMIYGDDKKGYLNFLTNYMPQMNKDDVMDKPVLFGAKNDVIDANGIAAYQNEMTDRHYKFIISPESTDVPIKELVRSFMNWLEIQSDHSLTWLAVEHRNTGHPHAHILINGKDRKTGELIKRFQREIVKNAARQSASKICTAIVGPRAQAQILAAKRALPLARRYTNIDAKIESKARALNPPMKRDDNTYEASITTADSELLQRLDILCALGLARKFENAVRPLYWLEAGWTNKLRTLGRYNTFLEARKSLCYTSASNLLQYTSDVGPITGVITRRITMDGENVWNNAIVVEDKENGRAWYIPLSKAVDERYLGSAVECNVTKGQSGRLRPAIRIIGESKKKEIGRKGV